MSTASAILMMVFLITIVIPAVITMGLFLMIGCVKALIAATVWISVDGIFSAKKRRK